MDRGVPFVDLGRQHRPLTEALEAALAGVLERGDFVLGEAVERFERSFAEYVGVEHAVGVGSGTAALAIALRAAGVGPGDEVIVPAHTYVATPFAVRHAGAEPVFCDVAPDTGLIDPASAAEAVGGRTAAIIPVHLYGQVAEMEAINELAESRRLLVLEDAAQAHGARRRGAMAGSFGDAAAFSFYPSKNLGALGDGGMVCTDDGAIASAARRWRNLGQREKGVHLEPGFNSRLDSAQAAVLEVKLPHLESWNASRREAGERYRAALAGTVAMPPRRPGAEDAFHLLAVRVPGSDRDRVRGELAEAGIGSRVHYHPAAHRQPAFATLDPAVPLPEAEAWADEQLSLPMFAGIAADEVERACAAIRDAVGTGTAPAASG